jgi:hypothetical protein
MSFTVTQSAIEKWTRTSNENTKIPFGNMEPQFARFGADNKFVTKRLTKNMSCDRASFGSDPAPLKSKECYTLDAFSASFAPIADAQGLKEILDQEKPTSPLNQSLARTLFQINSYKASALSASTKEASISQKSQVEEQLRLNPKDPAARVQAYFDQNGLNSKKGTYTKKGNLRGSSFISTQERNEKMSAAVNDWLTTSKNNQSGMDVLNYITNKALEIVKKESLELAASKLDMLEQEKELRRRLSLQGVVTTGQFGATAIQLRFPNFAIPTGAFNELYGNIRISIPLGSFMGVTKEGKRRNGFDIRKNYSYGRFNAIISLEVGTTNTITRGINGWDFLKEFSLGAGIEVHFSVTRDTDRGLTRLDYFTIDGVVDAGSAFYTVFGTVNQKLYEAGYPIGNWLTGLPDSFMTAIGRDRQQAPVFPEAVPGDTYAIRLVDLADDIPVRTDAITYRPSTTEFMAPQLDQIATNNFATNNHAAIAAGIEGVGNQGGGGQPQSRLKQKVWSVDTVEYIVAATWFSPDYAADVRCMAETTQASKCRDTFKYGPWSKTKLAPDSIGSGLVWLAGLQARWSADVLGSQMYGGIKERSKFVGATLRLHLVTSGLINYAFNQDAEFILQSTGIAGVLSAK